MPKPVQLVLVIHNHQPVGNFDHVIHEACDKAYLPFLRLLLEFPAIRIGLHTSGCLLEWLETNRTEYFDLVRELLKRGQLELLGGGMYEPILPILPQNDAHLQLQTMQLWLQQQFGVSASGMWTPERVWEPQLAQTVGNTYKFTLLDDYHFNGNALPQAIETEYFETEYDGKRLNLLPISQELRYCIPFKPPQATADYLAQVSEAYSGVGEPLVVFGDDGEKFGIWPETYEWVYERGWFREFLQLLSDNSEWIKLRLPAEVLAERAPVGNVYIPCRSYKEMCEWARVDPDAAADSEPGHWRNYLIKYPEVRDFYERMRIASQRMSFNNAGVYDGRTSAQTLSLLRSQCNCGYWHGVFGGIYLNYLRAALTKELLAAESAYYSSLQRRSGKLGMQNLVQNMMSRFFEEKREDIVGQARAADLDDNETFNLVNVIGDGQIGHRAFTGSRIRRFDDYMTEVQLPGFPGEFPYFSEPDTAPFAETSEGKRYYTSQEALLAQMFGPATAYALEQAGLLSAWLDLDHGLCLRRLDYYPTLFCWTDVLARRREHYHHKLEELAARGESHEGEKHASIHDRVVVKEPGLEQRLVVDPHQRVSFVTYFSDVANAEWFMRVPDPAAMPPHFSFRDFNVRCGEQQAASATPALSALVDHSAFALRKRISLEDGALHFSLAHDSGELPGDAGLFWVEFNLTVLTDSAPDRYLEVDGARQPLNVPLDFASVESAALVDEWQGRRIRLACPGRPRLFSYPVYTVSSSEGGFERTYQGTCIMLGYPPQALLGQIDLRLGIEELKA